MDDINYFGYCIQNLIFLLSHCLYSKTQACLFRPSISQIYHGFIMTWDPMKMQMLVHRSRQGWGQQSAFLESSQVLQLLLVQGPPFEHKRRGAWSPVLEYCHKLLIGLPGTLSNPVPTLQSVWSLPNANLNRFLHFPCFPGPQILPLPPIPPSGSHSCLKLKFLLMN